MFLCPLSDGSFVRSLNPDEQEVVAEAPRVVQNPPKPVMTARPTAVKATGITFYIFSTISFFRIKLVLFMECFVNCFSVG